MGAREIINAAVSATTLADAEAVQQMIEEGVGGRHQRPLGDAYNNYGLLSSPGSFDTKVIENVTNMQDAVVERAALREFGELDKVPYDDPREAARALLNGDRTFQEVADDVVVEFHESDSPTKTSRRLTVVCRDHGCGRRCDDVPRTFLSLGTSHKETLMWQQGAFGVGGKKTFRNAKAVVIVSRFAPELLADGEEDRITLAVLLWEQHGKSMSAYYLVEEPWNGPGHNALPYSAPSSAFPEFEAGTHVALISYGVEGFHRTRLGDERQFDTVLNTRLYNPITPVRFANAITRERNEYLRGLQRRLTDNPRPDRREGSEVLPFHIGDATYHLPIHFFVFSKRGEAGQRRNFVAKEHAVIFTSNGQAHKHWTPADFRLRTRLNKLHDRIFVVVETDELPIEVRTSLFTPDRDDLVRTDESIRLEDQVAGFLNEWNELLQINADLIKEAIAGDDSERATIGVARQISRALQVKGFSLGGEGAAGGGSGSGRRPTPVEVYPDPTTLEGPDHVLAKTGETKFISFIVNAVDDFMPRRGHLEVTYDHPDVTQREIAIGQLRGGRIRVSVAIPDGAELGTFKLEVSLKDWLRSSGGIGAPMHWTTKIEVVNETRPSSRSGRGKKKGSKGPREGGLVAVIWKNPDSREEWDRTVVGDVELTPAGIVAEARPEYSELAALGDQPIPTLVLNEHFFVLKRYIEARARELVDLSPVQDRYAVGAGVGLLLLDQDVSKKRKAGEEVGDDWLRSAHRAVARGVISMMPAFDQLAKEAGLDEV